MSPVYHAGLRIHGNRIDLTEIEPVYFAPVIAWRNDPDNSRSFFSHQNWTLEGQRRWYERYAQDPTDLTFIMVLKTGQPVGTVALYHIDTLSRTAEFGRVLNGEKQYRRRGFASEACRLCLDYGFDVLGLREIRLESYAWNDAANRLYEQLGFIPAQPAASTTAAGNGSGICRMTLQPQQRKYQPVVADIPQRRAA